MIVNTARFGEIEVNRDSSWTFLVPLLGFEDYRNFVNISDNNSPFEFIQSLEEENLTFVLTDPFLFCPEYEFTLEQRWLDLLRIEQADQVIVRSVVTVRSPSDISMNLKAPIIMNSITREAAQIILDRPEYSARYLLTESAEQEGNHADSIQK
ncbi:flagellar assembly protein FliW [Paenibacillus sp. YSY-4.3]